MKATGWFSWAARGVICLTLWLLPVSGRALDAPIALWDSEIESLLMDLALPLWQAANLSGVPEFTVILQDDVNAFVTPNRVVHVYSGLILDAENEDELRGVLAHEIGHIMGRHHLRLHYALKDTQAPILIGALLGVGAALAGAPDAGAALMVGSQATAMGQILSFSRSQERQADELGRQLLDKTEAPVYPLLKFLQGMRGNSLLYSGKQAEYLSTHPALSDRVSALRHVLQSTDESMTMRPPSERFLLAQAKLRVFQNGANAALRRYREDDAIGRYARSWAYLLSGKLTESKQMANSLLQEKDSLKKYPFLLDLKAQIALSEGKPEAAIKDFEHLLSLKKESPVTLLELADTYITTHNPQKAIDTLILLQRYWVDSATVAQKLGVAYGKANKLAESHLWLAEAKLINRNADEGLMHISYARQQKGAEALASRLNDVENALKQLKEEK